jgi:hypothetical protein
MVRSNLNHLTLRKKSNGRLIFSSLFWCKIENFSNQCGKDRVPLIPWLRCMPSNYLLECQSTVYYHQGFNLGVLKFSVGTLNPNLTRAAHNLRQPKNRGQSSP